MTMSDVRSKAWVWSEYRGELPADAPSAPAVFETEEPVAEKTAAAPGAVAKKASLSGLAIAGAVIVIAGLTWLFTTRPASNPAPVPPVEATEPAPAPAAESAPPPPPPVAETPAEQPPAAAPEAPKPEPEKPVHKKKHKKPH